MCYTARLRLRYSRRSAGIGAQSIASYPAYSIDIAYAVHAAAAACSLIHDQRAAGAIVVAIIVTLTVPVVIAVGVGTVVAAIDNVASVVGAAMDANAAFAGDGNGQSSLRRVERHGLRGRNADAKTEQGDDSYEQPLYSHDCAR